MLRSRVATGPGRGESAFTIIELIVAMILLALALALAITGLMGALRGGTDARNDAVSSAVIDRTAAAFRDDVARALAPDRDASKLRDPNELRQAISTGEVAYSSDPTELDRVLDLDDLVFASSRELRMRVDVDAARPGTECVQWSAAVADGRYTVTRSTYSNLTCTGGAASSETFIDSHAVDAVNTEPFSYRMLCSRDSCPGSAAPTTSPCRPWVWNPDGGTVDALQLRWIIGVGASFVTVSGDGGRASIGADQSVVPIRARTTSTYRRALGC